MSRYFKTIFVSLFLCLILTTNLYSVEEGDISDFKLLSSYDNSFKSVFASDILLYLMHSPKRYSSFSVYEVKSEYNKKTMGLVYVLYNSSFGYQIVPMVKSNSKKNDLLALELINATVSSLKIKKFSIPSNLLSKPKNMEYISSYYDKFDPNNSTYTEEDIHGDFRITLSMGTSLSEQENLTTFFVNHDWDSNSIVTEVNIRYTATFIKILNNIFNVDGWDKKDHSEIIRELYTQFPYLYYHIDIYKLLEFHSSLMSMLSAGSEKVCIFDYIEALWFLYESKHNLETNQKGNKSSSKKDTTISDFYMYLIENYTDKINYERLWDVFTYKYFLESPVDLYTSIDHGSISNILKSNSVGEKGEKHLYDILIDLHVNNPQAFEKFSSAIYSFGSDLFIRYFFIIPSATLSSYIERSSSVLHLSNIYKSIDNLSYESVFGFIKKYLPSEKYDSITKIMEYKKLVISLLLRSSQSNTLNWISGLLNQIINKMNLKLTIFDLTTIYYLFSGLNNLDIKDFNSLNELFIKSKLISKIKEFVAGSIYNLSYNAINLYDKSNLDMGPKSLLDLIDKIDSFSNKRVSGLDCVDKFSDNTSRLDL